MKYMYIADEVGLSVKNIDIQKVSRPKGYEYYYKNGRAKHGLIYVVSGAIKYTELTPEPKSRTVNPGEMIFIPEGCRCVGGYASDNTELRVVQFAISHGELPKFLVPFEIYRLNDGGELMEEFCAAGGYSSVSNGFYVQSVFYKLLCRISENVGKLPKKYDRIAPALEEISVRWNENTSVGAYADMCGMSEVNFRRLFREYTGASPIDYRNSVRLRYARARLQSGEYNVSETAEACGFTNLSFFIRLYKKKFGHTPKER